METYRLDLDIQVTCLREEACSKAILLGSMEVDISMSLVASPFHLMGAHLRRNYKIHNAATSHGQRPAQIHNLYTHGTALRKKSQPSRPRKTPVEPHRKVSNHCNYLPGRRAQTNHRCHRPASCHYFSGCQRGVFCVATWI